MSERNLIKEKSIAIAAARVLHSSFIEAISTETILYVEDDNLMRKTPNGQPTFVKKLSRTSNNLTQKTFAGRTFKIRKRNVKAAIE